MLQTERLVAEPNRSARVRGLTAADINDVYELRARLEAMAGERATDAERAGLAEATARFAEARHGADVDEVRAVFPRLLDRSPDGSSRRLEGPGDARFDLVEQGGSRVRQPAERAAGPLLASFALGGCLLLTDAAGLLGGVRAGVDVRRHLLVGFGLQAARPL